MRSPMPSDMSPATIASYLQNRTLVDLYVLPEAAGRFDVTNPATGVLLGTMPDLGAADAVHAIAAAETAQVIWQELGGGRRGALLSKWARLIRDNREDLAVIMTLEQGKILREARGEVEYAASFLDWFAEEGKRHYGDVIPSHKDGARLVTFRQPIGTTAAITPWNFPAAMITRKAGAALAAGCSMIVRPARETPFTAVALANLAQEAGIPGGVFTILTGKADPIVGALMASETIRALSFTGSTEVGKKLAALSAPTLKKVSMELGGHAPFIVLADADLDAAVRGVMDAKFATSGQDCLAVNKCFVHADLYDEFCRRAVARVSALVVGNGMEAGVDIGPLISRAAADKCEAHVADALARGARLGCGGARHSLGGNYYAPTVLLDVTSDMAIRSEETFGPVLPISRFTDIAAMIEDANDCVYGLAAYVYGRDLGMLWRVGEQLEYGMVAVNTASMTGPPIPFGGVKQSGLGREGSRHGLDEYSEIKYMCLGNIPPRFAPDTGEVR